METHPLPKESHIEKAEQKAPQRLQHDTSNSIHAAQLLGIIIG
jgi:hypothetical protein